MVLKKRGILHLWYMRRGDTPDTACPPQSRSLQAPHRVNRQPTPTPNPYPLQYRICWRQKLKQCLHSLTPLTGPQFTLALSYIPSFKTSLPPSSFQSLQKLPLPQSQDNTPCHPTKRCQCKDPANYNCSDVA
jgi:hypothetical protein